MNKPLSPETTGQPDEDGLIHDPDRQQMMFCTACGGHTMHTVSQAWKPQEPWRVTRYTTACLTCSLQRGKPSQEESA